MRLDCLSPSSYDISQENIPSPSASSYNYLYSTKAMQNAINIKDIFSDLAAQWYAETRFISSSDDMRDVQSYKKIVDYGEIILQSLIEEIGKSPSLLFMAAEEITGVDPVTEAMRGNVRLMAGAWVEWFQKSRRDWL